MFCFVSIPLFRLLLNLFVVFVFCRYFEKIVEAKVSSSFPAQTICKLLFRTEYCSVLYSYKTQYAVVQLTERSTFYFGTTSQITVFHITPAANTTLCQPDEYFIFWSNSSNCLSPETQEQENFARPEINKTSNLIRQNILLSQIKPRKFFITCFFSFIYHRIGLNSHFISIITNNQHKNLRKKDVANEDGYNTFHHQPICSTGLVANV